MRELAYLSLKKIISPRKVVTASKVNSGLHAFGTAGSLGPVGSPGQLNSVSFSMGLDDFPTGNNLENSIKLVTDKMDFKRLQWMYHSYSSNI